MNLTKVYIVRFGAYSDQGIAGVYSTEEKAQRYCDVHNEMEEYASYWIDERVIDEDEISPETKVVTYYCVCISLKDDQWDKAGEIYFRDEEKDILTSPVTIEKEDDYISVRSTTSMEHVEKVAIEQYQIYTQQKLEESL